MVLLLVSCTAVSPQYLTLCQQVGVQEFPLRTAHLQVDHRLPLGMVHLGTLDMGVEEEGEEDRVVPKFQDRIARVCQYKCPGNRGRENKD